MELKDRALLNLGRYLRDGAYRFVTPTPMTVQRVIARKAAARPDMRDIFGWNKPFRETDIPPEALAYLEQAGALIQADGLYRSSVRYSTIGNLIFVHSGFPTVESDSVFFGPDTYRFVRAIGDALRSRINRPGAAIVDVGAGSGAGGIFAASRLPAAKLTLADINMRALRTCAINAELNGIAAEIRESDVLAGVPDAPDIVLSNPPYLVDAAQRLYRHGGGDWGCELSVRIAEESLTRLSRDGLFLLYTGTPIVAGIDIFHRDVQPILKDHTCDFHYGEIDPDVFGEELTRAPYDDAERIAVVQLIVHGRNLRKYRDAP